LEIIENAWLGGHKTVSRLKKSDNPKKQLVAVKRFLDTN
jgi:hypothetical protein